MADQLFITETDVQTIRGTISRIIYHENGRLIARITLEPGQRDKEGRTRRVTSVLGSLVEPRIGQLYEFSGQIEFDAKYKQYQMRFDTYRTILPTDADGIASYLIDVARWVGPSIAKALIDAFGGDTLRVLKEEPDRVAALGVNGLTPDRVAEMSRSLKDNADLEAAAVELNNLLGGVLGPATVRKALNRWKCDAGTLVKANPFILTELHGVGFKSADAIHTKLAGDPKDINRHAACLCHILKEAASRDGHTFVDQMMIELESRRLVGGLVDAVWDLCVKGELIETNGPVVSLAGLARAEQYIASKIASMLKAESLRPPTPISTDGLQPDQVKAVQAFEPAQVFVLTGAPGTGKTYTVARIVRSLSAAGMSVGLCAPTGKAAKQMSLALADTCGGTAVTIHSLLEPSINEETGDFLFARNEANQLTSDVVVVDEFSMVDVNLARSLLRAIPETTRLLIVGDHYQLPSVGPGAVLRDLLAAGVPSVELKEIKRNAGRIVRACHAIKDGQAPAPSPKLDLDAGENWRHVDMGDTADVKAVIEQLLTERLPAMGVDPLWGVQIISPTNETGPLSCDSLNELAKGLLNNRPNADKLKFAVNDKILRTKNGYAEGQYVEDQNQPIDDEIRIVNGDLGVVMDANEQTITCRLRFPERIVRIPRKDHNLKLGYCLTCHKMQGSEVDVVILPITRDMAKLPMVTREWIYTALSRAKVFVISVGDIEALVPMVRRVGNTKRQTMLASLLKQRLCGQKVGAGKPEFDDL